MKYKSLFCVKKNKGLAFRQINENRHDMKNNINKNRIFALNNAFKGLTSKRKFSI